MWHVIPRRCVSRSERYSGTVEDERRLFYVSLTRAEKHLFCTWAPRLTNKSQRNVSHFFEEYKESKHVLTKEPKQSRANILQPQPRREAVALAISFSELKYYFDCPYLFKLRFLFGFDAPISRALGFGKSLHDALAEIHARSIAGDIPSDGEIPRLAKRHLHLPFANREVTENLERAAKESLKTYLNEHRSNLGRLEHAEKVIELKPGEGIVVSGRIDLIRRTDTEEIVVVDFKSDEKAQVEQLSLKQLQIYALGYQQLTGKKADFIEIHNLDRGTTTTERVDAVLMRATAEAITAAGKDLKADRLRRLKNWAQKCTSCDVVAVCRRRETPAPAPVP